MADDLSTLEKVRLRAFDLSERTTRLGYRSAKAGLRHWRQRGFLIAQSAVTAGIAWWVATEVLLNPVPFFAPVAAILVLSVTYGNRLRRGVEVALGVALGVAVGDGFVYVFGTGVWQVMVVVAVSMSLASLVGAGQVMTIQAAVQSVVVTTLLPAPGQSFGRWTDAVVGCVLALAVATIAPSSPLRKPGILAAQLLQEMAATLRAAALALREADATAADRVLERARAGEAQLTALQEAADEGLAVVRHSPFRIRQRGTARAYADLIEPLDRANRNLRVLARRSVIAVWRKNHVPEAYLKVIETTAEVAELMARELHEGRLPVAARKQLVAAAEGLSNQPASDNVSAAVILAQARSMLVDLMELTGLDSADARALVPDME